ncbi:MAG TPA: aspartate-semialdehyde dehydrogenase [Actinomycetota bacterium]|jgi:aspartate-semialdehyde dehydrogenase|nr:aspartate-semialdehyde dehydrogenase [Actinomycetota bacterium]
MGFRVGIVGATGVTGEVTLRILRERSFPVDDLRLFASRRSAGRKIEWNGREFEVEALDDGRFDGLDVVISATASSLSKEWTPRIAQAGAVVIDQSSAFRLDADVPLVVPEINAADARNHKGIIAGPNCTTAVAVMAVAPLQRAVGIRSVISSSYQSVSGAGRDGITEFIEHSRKAADQVEALRGHERLDLPEAEMFPRELAFNVFPHCESFDDGADTSTEEAKMQPEMRKMLGAPDLLVHATAVRVPVLVGHSVSLTVSLEREVEPEEARGLIREFPGLRLVDEPSKGLYPTPQDAAGIDEVLVGRVRPNGLVSNGLSLFACGDNLRKGNALNAVQVAELILGR